MRPLSLGEIWFLFKNGWQDLINTDFNSLKYSEVDLAIKVGAVVATLILLKLSWTLLGKMFGWNKYSRMDSGHTVSRNSERGLLAGFFLILPTAALLVPLTAILFAVANPSRTVIQEEKKHEETRTRIDFRDASSSMGALFKRSGKSKAEIAMNAHLKFLEMRRGKNDRTALWLFSDDPYPIQEDFIIDDELSYLKAFDAPWELGSIDVSGYSKEQWEKYTMPRTRYLQVSGQGGTQLSPALKMAIQLFDSDEKKQKKSSYYKSGKRSILIVTDAGIYDLNSTKADFEELGKRKITLYVIFIDETVRDEYSKQPNNIPELLNEVIIRGGKFFTVSDEKAIENAYKEIDKLETGRVEIEKKVFRVPAFYKFVFLGIIFLVVVVIAGLLTELLSYP